MPVEVVVALGRVELLVREVLAVVGLVEQIVP
jgi:hypothetical protein